MTNQMNLSEYESQLAAVGQMPAGPEREQAIDTLAAQIAAAQKANQAPREKAPDAIAQAQAQLEEAQDEAARLRREMEKAPPGSTKRYEAQKAWSAALDAAGKAINAASQSQAQEADQTRRAQLRPVETIQADIADTTRQLEELRADPRYRYGSDVQAQQASLNRKLRKLNIELEGHR